MHGTHDRDRSDQSGSRPAARAPLSVLARPAFAARKNPYTARLYGAMGTVDGGVRVTEWSLQRALSGRWDIVHVHWPESVFDHTLPEAMVTSWALLSAVDAARRRGASLVWTVHNLRAHGQRHTRAEDRFRRVWLERLDGVLALTHAGLQAAREAYPPLRERPAAVVPHPHYRGVYPDDTSRADARRRLELPERGPVVLFFGRVASYKGVPDLVAAFGQLADPGARLVIAGAPMSTADRAAMAGWPRADNRVRIVPEFIPSTDVQHYFRAADLVVLPFRDILNSGSAILALSFDRRVLAPARGAIAELAEAAGPRWVSTYRGALTTQLLSEALAAAALDPDRTEGAHIAHLDPEEVARETINAYHRFLEARERV
ncbi:MAG: glycosyltransferase [Myxococcales bacterium]|nr:glycosyltransferase [Myxococcales bacterium]MDD9965224.1 glycosyltransferase [Myxococcales bacterium]